MIWQIQWLTTTGWALNLQEVKFLRPVCHCQAPPGTTAVSRYQSRMRRGNGCCGARRRARRPPPGVKRHVTFLAVRPGAFSGIMLACCLKLPYHGTSSASGTDINSWAGLWPAIISLPRQQSKLSKVKPLRNEGHSVETMKIA
jgi:hypothetical protein